MGKWIRTPNPMGSKRGMIYTLSTGLIQLIKDSGYWIVQKTPVGTFEMDKVVPPIMRGKYKDELTQAKKYHTIIESSKPFATLKEAKIYGEKWGKR